MATLKTPKINDTRRRAAAKAWLRGAQWKVASMRGTRVLPPLTGEETDLPDVSHKTVRLFAKGCDPHLMSDVIELLGEEATIEDPKVDGVALPGVWYHRFAAWNRDSGQNENGDNTKTLIRDLNDGPLTFTSASEDGCGSSVSIRFIYEATGVETLTPDAQGTKTRLGGVSRDPDTGLFNYYVTVSVRKTIHTPEYVTTSDLGADVYTESWTGLYGTQDAPTDHNGTPVYVPGAEGNPTGTESSVEWSKDPEDCTWSARVRWSRSKKNIRGSESCDKDLFRHVDTIETQAQAAKLGEAPEATGGVKKRHVSRKRKDKLFDNTVETDTEKFVDGARVTVERTLFEQTTSETDKSTTVIPAASVSNGVITAVSKDRTPGDLADVTVTTRRELSYPNFRVSSSSDAFTTRESKVDRAQTISTVPSSSSPAVGSGVVTDVTSEVTPGGRRNNSVETRTEKSYPDAEVTEGKTIFQTSRRATHRSSSGSVPASVAAGGVIKSVSFSVTPGNRKNITEDTVTERNVVDARKTVSDTLFETETVSTDKSASAEPETPVSGGGKVRRTVVDKTPGGLLDVTKSETTEKYVPAAASSEAKTIYKRSARVTDKNSPVTILPPASAVGGITISINGNKTPGGLIDVTTDTETELTVTDARVSKSDNAFASEVSVTDRSLAAAAEAPVSGGGVVRSVSSEKTPGGMFDVSRTIQTEKEVDGASIIKSATMFKRSTRIASRSKQSPGSDPVAERGTVQTVTSEKTPGGKYNVTVDSDTEVPYQSSRVAKTVSKFSTETTVVDRAQPAGVPDKTPGNGLSYSTTTEATPGGLYDNSTVIRKEEFVPDAAVTVSETIFSKKRRKTDRGSPPGIPPSSARGGVMISATAETTPGGLQDISVDTDTELQVLNARVAKNVTLTQTRTAEDHVNTAMVPPKASALDGVIVSTVVEKTPGGLTRVSLDTVTEVPLPEASIRDTVLPWITMRTVEDVNLDRPNTLTTGQVGLVSLNRTPGKFYIRSKTTVLGGSIKPGYVLSHTKDGNASYSREVVETIETEKDFGTDVGLSNNGMANAVIRDVTFTSHQDGYFIKRVETRIPAPARDEWAFASYVKFGTADPKEKEVHVYSETHLFYNQPRVFALNILEKESAYRIGKRDVSLGMSRDEFGLYSGTFRLVLEY